MFGSFDASTFPAALDPAPLIEVLLPLLADFVSTESFQPSANELSFDEFLLVELPTSAVQRYLQLLIQLLFAVFIEALLLLEL